MFQSEMISTMLLHDCYMCMLYCTAIAVVQLYNSAELARVFVNPSLKPTAEVTSSSISLVAWYKQRLPRSITVFIKCIKLNFSYYR